MSAKRGILMTGTSGFIGGELLGRLISHATDVNVHCLLRARDAEQLERRRRALVSWAGIGAADAERVKAVAGDITDPLLGLGPSWQRLASEVEEIYHSAASTKFDLSLEDARAINRDGALHVLEFARQANRNGGLRRLHYLSTAYVVGDREGVFGEDAAAEKPRFRNTYEATKWESEQLLAPERAGVPVTCYRPSIVVGDSRTGRTLHFRVLYDPVRWIYEGKLQVLPCRPRLRLDVVPVDFVCDALLALAARDDTEGGTFHLTSGPEHAASITELIEIAVATGNRYHAEIGAPPIVPPAILSLDEQPTGTPEERERAESIRSAAQAIAGGHIPYMTTEQLFDARRCQTLLKGTGIDCPPLRDYFDQIVRWGIERGFTSR